MVPLCLLSRAAFAQDDEPQTSPPLPEPPQPTPAALPAPNEVPVQKPDPNFPRRQGFTIELGLGVSYMGVDSMKNVESGKVGLAPLSLGLGAFVSRDVAISFRMTGTSLFQDRGGKMEQVVLGFYGGAIQYYVSERAFVGGGLGLGLVAGNPLVGQTAGVEAIKPRAGLAGLARVGVVLYADKANQLALMSEVVPAYLGDDTNAVGVALALGFQHY
jgi:hypothetical protein